MIGKIKKGLYIYYKLIKGLSPHARLSFGQEGEDMVLAKIFQFYRKGFYIDVGAHHPEKYSNTKFFYNSGWNGINVDPIPGMKRLFDAKRPRDINIEKAVGTETGSLPFYVFKVGAYNTFSEQKAKEVQRMGVELLSEHQISISPLSEILDKHLKEGQEIEFMNVDAETWDMEVLKSNDWNKYRPKIILAEMLRKDLHECQNDPMVIYMKDQGYTLLSKTVNTAFFKRVDFDMKEKPN